MRVYCTNPRCLHPENHSDGDLTDRNSITARFCISCGMPLFIGGNRRCIALSEIGKGGFGKTFKGYDFNLEKEIAIKVFSPQEKLTPQQLDTATIAFKKGSQILSNLSHRYIPRVYDFLDLSAPINNHREPISGNYTQQKLFFLIQDYIPGENLQNELGRHDFSEDDVLAVLRSLLQILKDTHEQGVIHRDIKPSNIIRHRDNHQLYLIDFDTAIKRKLEPGVSVEFSFAIGSLGYAPPEQLSGREIDMSADLYALAATCVNLLTNRTPTNICHDGGSLNIWKNYLSYPIQNGFVNILDKMLAFNPQDRFQSAEQVLEAIDNLSTVTIQQHNKKKQQLKKNTKISRGTFWDNFIQKIRKRWKYLIGFIALFMLGFILVINPDIIYNLINSKQPTSDNICANYPNCPINDGFSWGEEIMFPQENNPNKQRGTEAFKQENYKQAIEYFKQSLNSNPNDPETLVYLNNALASVSPGKEIKISVNIPITSNANSAKEILRGVAHVQSQVNCGINAIKKVDFLNSGHTSNCPESGIDRRRLQILITDYSKYNDNNRVKNIYKKVANDPSILGVIGPFTSSETSEAGEIYSRENSREKLVLISPTSTVVREMQEDPNPPDYALPFNKYIFRTSPTDSTAAKDLVEYMRKQQYKQPVIIMDKDGADGEYSKSLSGEFQKFFLDESQNQNIEPCDMSSSGNTAVKCIRKAQNNADVAMLALSHNQVKERLQQLGFFLTGNNPKIKVFLGGDGIYEKDMIELINNDGKLVLAVPWHRSDGDTAEESQFERESQELWQTRDVNWRTAMSYDATQAMAEGLKRDAYPTRKSLFEKLSSETFQASGASVAVQFDRNTHDRKLVTGIGVLVRVQNSEFVLLETPER